MNFWVADSKRDKWEKEMEKSVEKGWVTYYRWRNAQIGDGLLESATECSNWQRLGYFWVIGNDGLSSTVGFLTHLFTTVAYWRRLAYRLQRVGALCDDEDGVGVPLVFRLLGVKWNKRRKWYKMLFIVRPLVTQYLCR